MALTIKKFGKIAWQLFSVTLTSVVTGAGIGLFEGEVFARSWSGHAQITFAESASLFGGTVALAIGPILYYALFRRRVSFEQFAGIIACAGIVGCSTAIISELLAPIATVVAALFASMTVLAWRASPPPTRS